MLSRELTVPGIGRRRLIMTEFCGETLQLSLGSSVGPLEQLKYIIYRNLSIKGKGKRAFWMDNIKILFTNGQ